jgi:hypothetical protein
MKLINWESLADWQKTTGVLFQDVFFDTELSVGDCSHVPMKAEPREEVMRALQTHEFYVYDLNLGFKWSTTGENLILRLRSTPTYLVDNNISWKKRALAHPEVNFIVGCTLCEEAENLEAVLFSKLPAHGYPNVFAVDRIPQARELHVFHRIDENYKKARFDGAIPLLSRTSAEHRADRVLAAALIRIQIESYLGVAPEELRRILAVHVAQCPGNLEHAGMAAVIATALYFQQLSADRLRTKIGKLHLPGDSRLIAEALLYGCGVLSDDKDVRTMARIAGVTVICDGDLRS